MDKLSAMDTFVRIIDTGSFSAVARHQGVGQPAVSKTIAQLEDWLGVRLLLRSTRSVTATEAGESFYARAKRTIEEADEAVLAARGATAGVSGRLRVSASVCFARIHIVPNLSGFLARNPDLDLELVLDDRSIDLVGEGIDVALRTGAQADSSMGVRKLGQARRLVMATPSYWDRNGRPKLPADLTAHRAVIYSRDAGGPAWLFRRDDVETMVPVQGRLKISATEGLRAAVLADLGFTIISQWAFTPELRSGAIEAVLTDWTLPAVTLSAVFPTGRLVSAKARAFVAFVETCMTPAPDTPLS